MRGADARDKQRFPIDSEAGLAMANPDGVRTIRVGRCTNWSETGVQLVVAEPVAVHTFVEFQVREPKIHGSGTVRYCRQTAAGYAIGILVGDSRTFPREAVSATVELSPVAPKVSRAITVASCANLSKTGMKLISPEPFDVDSLVEYRVDRLNLAGIAKVRHCRKTATGYALGLHFENDPA